MVTCLLLITPLMLGLAIEVFRILHSFDSEIDILEKTTSFPSVHGKEDNFIYL